MHEVFDVNVAEVYDLLYRGRGKDYAAESQTVADLVLAHAPHTRSLLDVGCGTGIHLQHLAARFPDVQGLDLSAPMLAQAARRLPEVPLHCADMSNFALDRQFDAVVSLFTAVGYLPSVPALQDAIACFARHLRPGGVVIVEPWWFPDTYLPGYVSSDLVEVDGYTISRVTHSGLDGDTSLIDMHYLVAGTETGVRHFEETHRLTLFTRDQYEAAFKAAGLSVSVVESAGEHTGHPYFVGVA